MLACDGFFGKREGRDVQGLLKMDLTGHHSNPSRPLKLLLEWAFTARESHDLTANPPSQALAKGVQDSIGTAHRRHDWVLSAVIRVLEQHGGPMRAREVHMAVERLLGSRVSRASVKACLAANATGASPRFVRIAWGQYAIRERR